ncbi:AraC family transcriptional regulator [Saccharopolyspora sp. TS4A08]|uniref:AraC family transcriptional regulator n=1 Tax=Saccharopolyspora ipomoeae TaxID=3042027 RepID=A0ABT6PIP9_9PSEU|nr:AraC family transcriptional regulator [Saccharopolyspora sp. TS4A08]MDI2027874.1 AraC family transcriptional regulator [Saccharopolyspora sp. TS4A08]
MGQEWVSYRRSARMPVEVMRAHFEHHRYDLHAHEAYSFGCTEVGAQTFRCRGAQRTSAQGMVMAFNPEDPHDGHAVHDGGFTYQIVHISPELIGDVLADTAGKPVGLPLFAEPVLHEPALASALRGVHDALTGGESALAQDEALHAAVRAMVRLGAVTAAPPGWAPETRQEDDGLRQVRELLHEHFAEDVGTARLAEISGRSRFALHRAFRDLHGLTPSEYQRQLRVRHARRLLASGRTPAEAAVESGFADQSHLTRWFRRYYAITPARFRDAARDQASAS